MYSSPNLEPVRCPVSGSDCCFLTCIQISQGAGQVAWYSHLFKNFPQFIVIYTAKDFSIVNEAEYFWNSLAFSMIQDVGSLISDSSAFSKSILNSLWAMIQEYILHTYLSEDVILLLFE